MFSNEAHLPPSPIKLVYKPQILTNFLSYISLPTPVYTNVNKNLLFLMLI